MSSPEARKSRTAQNPKPPSYQPTEFEGRRVELHPATDRWMQGDRFGTILGGVANRSGVYYVRLDRSGTTARLHIDNLRLLEE